MNIKYSNVFLNIDEILNSTSNDVKEVEKNAMELIRIIFKSINVYNYIAASVKYENGKENDGSYSFKALLPPCDATNPMEDYGLSLMLCEHLRKKL